MKEYFDKYITEMKAGNRQYIAITILVAFTVVAVISEIVK